MKGGGGGEPHGFETDDLYTLLNVSSTASVTEIQRSYKKLSRVYHPDKLSFGARTSGLSDAQRTFVAVKQAYDVLSDPIYRLAYDYGGLLAVILVKRSQAVAHSHKQAAARAEGRENSGDSTTEEEDEEVASIDLYSELHRSPERVAVVLQQALDEYHWHQGAATRIHMTSGIDMHHTYWNSSRSFSRFEHEGASFQFQSRRPLSSHSTVTLGATSSVQSTAETDVSATGGLELRPARGTQVNVDVMLHPRSPVPQLSFRTSRQMADGNFFMTTLAGRPFAPKTWSYSFISYRSLLWESATSWIGSQSRDDQWTQSKRQQDQSKLQASWRLGIKPAAREIAFIMASIKTTSFPQWAGRLALGNAYPFKITYQEGQESEGTPYLSLSTSGLYSRFKVAWLQHLGPLDRPWTFKYGIKYDGRAVFIGESPWTAFFQLYSEEWTFRLPISLFCNASIWPIASLLTTLICQWLDQQLDQWIAVGKHQNNNHSSIWDDSKSARKPIPPPPVFPDIISSIAAKKRRLELEKDGLVVLQARWYPEAKESSPCTNGIIDVSDALQFWVVDGHLHLPMHEARWWRSAPEADVDEVDNSAWTWNWSSLLGRQRRDEEMTRVLTNGGNLGALTVRYQFSKRVYEISFDGDELIWLPNTRATELGFAKQVS